MSTTPLELPIVRGTQVAQQRLVPRERDQLIRRARADFHKTPNDTRNASSPPSAGRGFPISSDFSVMTGYVTSAVAQLVRLRDQGVITDSEYDTALTYQDAG
jgi:hypothetical protein